MTDESLLGSLLDSLKPIPEKVGTSIISMACAVLLGLLTNTGFNNKIFNILIVFAIGLLGAVVYPTLIGVGLGIESLSRILSRVKEAFVHLRRKLTLVIVPKNDAIIEVDKLNGMEKFINIVNEMGVEDGSETLLESEYAPHDCVDLVTSKLHFMGVFGSKWVVNGNDEKGDIIDRFETMLGRLENSNENFVKFLVMSPYCGDYERYNPVYEDRIYTDSAEIPTHYPVFIELAEKFDSFLIRFYESEALLRMTRINDDELYLSHYSHDYDGDYSDAPHIEIHSGTDWTLYRPLRQYFERCWKDAKTYEELKDENGAEWGQINTGRRN